MQDKKENKKYKKEVEIACLKCRTKFDAWVVSVNFESDVEKRVRKSLYRYCAVCKLSNEYSVEKGRA